MTDIPQLTLNDGTKIPAVGFGTYKLNGKQGAKDIVRAIHNGYYFLDSAFNYENEGTVGEAVRQSGLSRDKIQITSKLPGRRQQYDQALVTIEESLYRARLDYYDFYLIHWPNPQTGHYVEAWQALIEARKRGMIKSIGVCNFLPEHLDNIIKETGVTPCLNQIELHPYFSQETQRAYNKKLGIVTQSWSPIGRANNMLQNPVIQEIADQYQRSIAQVILRWHIQLGAMPIPKATSDERQKENLSLFDFELSQTDIDKIKGLDKPDGRLKDQDPARYEEF
ncbi:Aldo/keto reductase [Commensalibacter communis]|uniref:Related to diketogulonate reductase (ARA1) n=1 Tax=Commensalibacter communis TaxID=2972786 RepID=A0A9W4X5I3_9PROT|nr:aldo/keto reductase [Commensalibacter communis]CAI3922630.1 Aldo/keto reductase [Commensalibacter communis]CAI3923972.1 Aldo/keto reductase [Commensalibacter communis]CAI3938434.1 Aldo/keto reductase [Commensalibacter communis]CAI3939000.1 Aldo/keto reductase [Commensalibacter communis]